MTLTAELKKRAQRWATEITNKAKANLGDKADLIGVSSRSEDKGGIISFTVTAKNIKSNEWGVIRVARAYEYGSGIHGKKKDTYVIKPRPPKKVLAFEWDVLNSILDMFGKEGIDEAMQYSGKYVGMSSEVGESGYPKHLFRYVDHPGVEAVKNGRGYMKPAIDSVRKKMNKEIRETTRGEVKATIRRAFK